jgi:molybdopterin molybdotransferase
MSAARPQYSSRDALAVVLDSVREMDVEAVGLDSVLGRILARDVVSDMDMPPFDASVMDGYACRGEDIGNPLRVIGIVPAGTVPDMSIGRNECAKIMTGAPVPRGADRVVKLEDTEPAADGMIRYIGAARTRTHIRAKAEDFSAGGIVAHAGVLIRPEHIAVMAMAGCTDPFVSRRPTVGIVATGSELVKPSETPGMSQIRNSNSYQISAQVAHVGALPRNYGCVGDTVAAIDAALKTALAENDVVIVSGGVSKGDFDLVPESMERNGIEILFDRVGVDPGRPMAFGLSDTAWCFGLAGNPVSSFTLFEKMVRPFLFRMMHHEYRPCEVPMILGSAIRRKSAGRDMLVPVLVTENGRVVPVSYNGSAHISSLARADGLLAVPAGISEICEGETVSVRLL